MMDASQITGLVLAGGRATRMGALDKGLQLLDGAPLTAHVLRRLAGQVGALAINANRNLEAYAAFGVPVWPDDLPGFAGPLAGLQTGLRRASTELVLCAPCDCPRVPLDLGARLLAALFDQDADLALPETVDAGAPQPQPVFTLARRSVLAAVSRYLEGGGRRMDGWHAGLTVARVPFDAGAFANINTLAELRQFTMPE